MLQQQITGARQRMEFSELLPTNPLHFVTTATGCGWMAEAISLAVSAIHMAKNFLRL